MHTFTCISFGMKHLWARDIDRTPPRSVINQAAKLTGLDALKLAELTLGEQIIRVCGPNENYIPWLLRLGIYHRKRKQFGIQYCPQCLSEKSAFMKHWRWGFVVNCDVHPELSLLDSCPHCASPIVPHRSPRCDITKCSECGKSLCNVLHTAHDAGDIQYKLLTILQGSKAEVDRLENTGWHRTIPRSSEEVEALFRGIRDLVSCLCGGSAQHALVSMGYEVPASHTAFECLRLDKRVLWLRVLSDALKDGEKGLAVFLNNLALTRNQFSRGDFPPWMVRAISTLPQMPKQHRQRKPDLFSVLQRLANVHRGDKVAYELARERAIQVALSTRGHRRRT